MGELTDERIAEFKALRAAITPPPWYAEYHDGPDIDDLVAFFRKAAEYSTRTRLELVMTGYPNEDGICPEGTVTVAMTGNGSTSEANAAFISQAPECVDDLLAELERQRAESRQWQEYGMARNEQLVEAKAEVERLRGENERLLSVAKNLGYQCRVILDYWDKPLSPGEQVWQRKAEQYLTELEKLIIERALRGEASNG
jgi:hypothetical protein